MQCKSRVTTNNSPLPAPVPLHSQQAPDYSNINHHSSLSHISGKEEEEKKESRKFCSPPFWYINDEKETYLLSFFSPAPATSGGRPRTLAGSWATSTSATRRCCTPTPPSCTRASRWEPRTRRSSSGEQESVEIKSFSVNSGGNFIEIEQLEYVRYIDIPFAFVRKSKNPG